MYDDFGAFDQATENTISLPSADTKRKATSRPGSTLAFTRDQPGLYEAPNGHEGINGGYIPTQDAMERFSVSPKHRFLFCRL